MKIEFKCDECPFKGEINWPEEQIADGISVLATDIAGKNPMSDHHDDTKAKSPQILKEQGFDSGHGNFVSTNYPHFVIKFLATKDHARIKNYGEYMDDLIIY